ncbi:MAG: ABC-type nitrate/sulfonate/bicarbonate transport system [Candidatus Alkanophagales archaeon MCA70_species_1]|nr:ABC-type nitrate/sulfonate/bicarbonate transport system [Candidatus Alkanophaga volatiphilum]
MNLTALKGRILEVISLCVAVFLWQMVSDYVVRNYFILPSPYLVARSLLELWTTLPVDIAISMLHFGIGLSLGTVVGVSVGAVTGWFRVADRIADPIIEIIRPIPPLAWVPFAIVWFHLTHRAAGFIVFIGAVFPILINTYAGFRGVPRDLVDAALVLGCKKEKLMLRVAFPYALPSIATGVRIGMGVGWMCVVAAEMFGVSRSGLGYRLFQIFYPHHKMAELMLYMLILGLISLLLDRVFRHFVEERLLAWKKELVAEA